MPATVPEKLPYRLTQEYATNCVAGVRGLELANVVFAKGLK